MSNKKIDQLQTEVSDIQKSLDELKSKTLSEADKKTKTEEIKSKAETTKQEIQIKIDQLKDKEDADSVSEREKAETLLKTLNDTINLQLSIGDQTGDKSKAGEVATTETQSTAVSPETPATTGTTDQEEKGFFGKAGDWIGEQRSDVWSGDKRKEQPGQNLLRTVGFGVTGIALYKGVKKLRNRAFGKEEKKEDGKSGTSSEESSSKKKDDEKSFWDGTVGKVIKGVGTVLGVGTGVYYVAHGLYTKNRGLNDLRDRERGKKLEFDAALEYCKGAISNQDNKEGMSYGMDLKYHEDTGEIEAYGERIKIDKNNRKIIGVGLGDVEFKKYEHMINTAILIAYLKKNYSGKCTNNNPFYLTGDWQGDININTGTSDEEAVDGSGNGGRIVGITAGGIAGIVTGIYGGLQAGAAVTTIGCAGGYMLGSAYDHNNIMNDHMPELDNEFGKKSLGAYLNSMDCRQARNQTKEDITESPIKDRVWEVVEAIQKENPDLPAVGGQIQFDAIQDNEDKNKYLIKAYGREISAEVTGNKGSEEIRILGISGGHPSVKTDMTKGKISDLKVPLKEGLYMSAILGEIIEKFHHKGKEYPYFDITWKLMKYAPGIVARKRLNGDSREKVMENGGLYLNDTKRTINPFSSDFWSLDSLVYPNKKLEENMPTIFKKDKGKRFLEFLNDGVTDEANVSIWKKPN